MYLSKLELFGFKSFAQRINVKFDSGMTAIVGPNGCGKTNIVDAIRWVLGEQKTSVLRSDKMENVIFNGTRARKPLGMSEVSITIENTKNILPTEYTEVTLTRRLYRNGDSEYLLNKVPCRLKDITDLFTDTGMGSDAYSVIELKMIEQILSENAEERRKLFEEAAGITKYKQRRKQTFKKLESTALDLARVQDIVVEVEKKVGSLERQAKKAEQAKLIREELKHLEINLAERTLAILSAQTEPLVERLTDSENEKINLSSRITTLDADVQKMRLEQLEVEKELASLQRKFNDTSELINTTEKQVLSNKERHHSLTLTAARATGELATIEQRQADLAAQREVFKAELSKASEHYELERKAFNSQSENLSEKELALKAQRDSLENKRREISTHSEELAVLRLKSESLRARVENFSSQIQRSEERKALLHRQITERTLSLQSHESELVGLQRSLEALQHELTTAKEKRAALTESIAKSKESLLQLRAEESTKQTRIEFLKSLLESYEGLPEGVEFLDKEKQKSLGLGVLSDLIATDEQYKLAIDVALGEALSFYLSRTTSDALQAISELKASNKGKLTFIVLEKLGTLVHQDDAYPDELTPAIKLIRCSPEIRPSLSLLLQNVFITSSLSEASLLSTKYPNFTFATLTGEMQSHYSMRGGSSKGTDGLRIGKREELDRLDLQRKSLLSQIAEIESDIDMNHEALNEIVLTDIERYTREVEQKITAEEKLISQQSFEKTSFEEEIKSLEERISFDQAESQKINDDFINLQPTISSLEEKVNHLNRQIEIEKEEVATFENTLQTLVSEVRQKELSLKSSEYEVEKIQGKLISTESESRNAIRQVDRLTEEIHQAKDEQFRLASELETMNANLQRLYTEKSEQQTAISFVEGNYTILKSDLLQIETSLRDLSRQREVVSEVINELQQTLTKAQIKREHTLTMIQTEYGLVLEDRFFDDESTFNRVEAEEKATHLKNKLRNLGAVNELALEEFEAEKQRLDFLTSQRQDLIVAETQLRETIEEINTTAQTQFQETFNQIRQNFINIFRELFNEGDEADLVMEESEDKLEANIEIIAKPKGKRPQAITLLSGGEKTLTATSLLFAIYLVKPSPFCILDEVDAPLDDANVDRFVKLINKFAVETQFIVVTHNKRTMEACRMLYGVTMEEEGVSKLVSVKFDDAQKN